jgi:dTDP-4-amino-4,6-dideoxygalactose transaminase
MRPFVPDYADPVWHQYVIRSRRREALQADLAAAGVGTMIYYPIPPHKQRAYEKDPVSVAALPVAERLAEEVLSLPMSPHLSAKDAAVVVDALCRSPRNLT